MPKLCEFENCRKQATYGYSRSNRERCGLHKEDRKLCSRICVCGESKPTFNNPGETKALYCSACSKDGMVDVINQKCIECKVKQPVFNNPGETKALYCSACSKDGMVDIKHPKCVECKVKQPNFNNPGETKALYCSACSKDGMVDIRSPKCIECKVKQPVFNNPGETKALYCSACSKDGMVDVNNPKCKGQSGHCPQRGNKKYMGYYTFLFLSYVSKGSPRVPDSVQDKGDCRKGLHKCTF